jgi:hypothetical protein
MAERITKPGHLGDDTRLVLEMRARAPKLYLL